MNVHAHLHGQVPVQVDEGGSKLPQQNGNSLAHHMQNGGANNMDHDLMMHRRKVQEIITQSLMRSAKFSSGQWVHKVSELARKLEERIFKSAISKEEYMNTTKMKVDQYLQAMMRTAPGKNQLSSHHILSSSAISTMMPTPGILHSVNTVNSVSSLGNSVMKTNGASMGQLPTANGSVGVGSNASLNSSNGPGYNVITADISDPGTFYNTSSSSVTPAVAIGEKVNSMSLHKKPKTDHTLLNHHVGLQSSQQTSQIKPQIFDSSQHMDFSKENLCSQNQMQNFQYQQFQQHNQLYDPQHNQSQPNKQHLSKTDCSRQSSTPSTVGGQSMQEGGIESKNGLSIPQSDQQYQMSEFPNEYRQKTITNINSLSKSSQFHCQLSSPQDFRRSFSQKQVLKSQNESTCLLNALEPKSNNLSSERQFHDEFQQRINGQVEDQKSQTLDGCTQPTLVSTKNVSIPVSSSGIGYGLDNPIQERNFRNQRRWLLFLLHSRRCSAPVGSCPEVHCWKIQKLWLHMQKCNSQACQYPYCFKSRQLLRHYHQCQVEVCPVCSYVRKFVATHNTPRDHSHINTSTEIQRNEPQETHLIGNNGSVGSASIETSDILKASSPKRLKAQHSCPSPTINRETSANNLPLPQGCQQAELIAVSKLEPVEIMIDPFPTMGSGDGHLKKIDTRDDEGSKNLIVARSDVTMPLALHETNDDARHETVRIEKEIDEAKIEVKQEANVPQVDAGSESGKPKIRGVSLTELFTPEQIREHIVSLRKWVGQSKAKAEKNQAMELSMSENSCQLCAVEKLTFESPPIYCTPCGFRIKRNAIYYTTPGADTRYYFCIPCYNESRGYTIEVDGSAVPKTRLEKRRNDDETEESWVQCDKCESWQHQICALFNARRNDGGQAEYSCPNCYVVEIKNGERKPLPQGAVLGAKDLPRSILSDHIEQRLFTRLKQERQERARHLGKRFDEVPGAEELVVRVVSSVDKKLEVKQQFLEIFKEENFPTDFPYKSKVILLFQRIEGVEVCLFGMYVQEFGSECQFPNQRRVYLSYLDSVKYFRPEIKTVTGEALRTFVYHEILIGYLEYCKKRGFASCYIWACPPPKGEDYILYCHPEIQKTPKSDKLREWYLAMLRKAAKENIVVELTNLYDHFFETIGECKAKVSAARLPYFEGDYLPGAAEDMINQLRLEEDGRKQQKKGTKILTKRALKAAGQSDLSGNASKDALLMQKLGDTISLMKEDFIMVHLQHSCTHCCILMVSGTRWVCKQCKNFQLCQNCHDAEERLDVRNRHPITRREKHELFLVAINGVPSDTKDKDETLESEFFDTRQAFLNLCQLNHYQYDTLRRAKHASMMLLYHLHNPTAPAFLTTCNVCFCDIEAGQSWHCEFCTDFIVCSNCYHKEGGVDHPHKLSNHPSSTDHDTQNKKNQQQRELQQRILLDLLMHASQCKNVHCQYRNCRSMKNLFRHGIYCKTRAAGGCVTCKKVWYLLQLHARACKQSGCVVPRCKDLKEHFKRLQHQSETQAKSFNDGDDETAISRGFKGGNQNMILYSKTKRC